MAERVNSGFQRDLPPAAGFLSGGGEMAKIIRDRDWTDTPMGPLHSWPQSLRTSLSIVLHSKFPMVLLWGEKYIFFYNDAYRPTLGTDGKHPFVLGQPASEIYKESWHAVESLIDKVYSEGESVLVEDQLIPIYRNGKTENIYWTFSYSPLTDETDSIAGVFITCLETTDKVLRAKSFEENTRSLDLAMEIAELGVYKIDLVNNRSAYSQQIMEMLGLEKQNVPLPQIFEKIHSEDKLHVSEVFEKSIEGANDGKHDVTYRVLNPATGNINYLRSIGQVVFEKGKAVSISGIIQDISQQVKSNKILEDREKAFRNLVMGAPVAIAVYRGPDMVAEIVNDAYLPLVGKTRREFVGKPLFHSLPHVKTIVEPIVREVYRSGKSFPVNELEVKLNRYGRDEMCWFNSVWEPFYENDGEINGVIVVANEITEQVLARKKVEESEERYRMLIEEATVATGLFVGRNLEVKYANNILLGYWGKDKSALGRPLAEAVPELKGQPFLDYLENVFVTGIPYEGTEEPAELMVKGKLQTFYFNFTYKAVRNKEGNIYGIYVMAINVTGEVLAKKAVLENEERLRIAIEGGDLGTYIYFPKSGEISWSAKTKDFFGLPPEAEVNYDVFTSCIHPEDREKAMAVLESEIASEGKGVYENEYRIVRITDGKIRWIRSIGKVKFGDDGRPERLTGIIQDITERKTAEEALRESKDRFQAAVAAIEGILWTNNAKGEMEGEQPGWAFITGQRYEEYQGYGWAKAVHPDDAQATINAWQEALRERKTFVFEHRLLLRDGTWGYFSIRSIPLLNPDGSIREWVGVHTNITERKVAELALKESEARFRSLADQSPMIVFIAEPDANVSTSYFNKTFLDYTGKSFEESIGNGWVNNVHPDDVQSVYDTYVPAFQNKRSYTHPAVRLRRYDGEYRWHMFKANPRHLSNGEFIGFVGVGIDIHEQKLALEQLKLNNDQLTRINNDLDNFIYTASHDLKAPMSNIEGLLHALRNSFETEKDKLNEETESLMALMEQSVNRFKRTILDLTEISKAQREQDDDVHEINLDEVIDDVKLSIQDKIKESNASVNVDLSKTDTIRFSKKNIKSIIYNLLSNAIKYRHEDRHPEVFIKTENIDSYTVLTVKDNGLGIPEGHLSKVFSMFKRLHDHVEGSGIGLYIVKRIIDNTGGKIEVESQEGQGTTFRIYFPR